MKELGRTRGGGRTSSIPLSLMFLCNFLFHIMYVVPARKKKEGKLSFQNPVLIPHH